MFHLPLTAIDRSMFSSSKRSNLRFEGDKHRALEECIRALASLTSLLYTLSHFQNPGHLGYAVPELDPVPNFTVLADRTSPLLKNREI